MSRRLHARTKGSKSPARTVQAKGTTKTVKPVNKPKPRAKSAGRRLRSAGPGRTGPARSIGIRGRLARAAGPGATAKSKAASHMVRRNRVPVALGALVALVVLGTSFPASALLSQHRQLSASGTQLSQLQHENRLLTEQEHQLSSTAEIKRLARQDYQLVYPGQSLYEILPAAGHATTTTAGGMATGDPGQQPLVAPADAPDMSPDPGLPQTPSGSAPAASSSPTAGAAGAAGGAASEGSGRVGTSSSGGSTVAPRPSSFWSRVTDTLEFWK